MAKKKLTLEEKKEKVREFRPIDDTFFEVLATKAVCQELLRTVLNDEKLIVEDVITQSSEKNLYGRSVRLDALCILGTGEECNIEIQRSDNDDHLRRVRMNASSITVRDSQKGTKFKEIPDLIVVYISEFDLFEDGKTLYHVDSVVRETKEKVDDGLYRVFVNTEAKDGTKVSRLMSHFTEKTVKDAEFPELTARMHELKEKEGGLTAMCDVMEKYEKIAADKATAEANQKAIRILLNLGATKDQILSEYTEEEYENVINDIAQN